LVCARDAGGHTISRCLRFSAVREFFDGLIVVGGGIAMAPASQECRRRHDFACMGTLSGDGRSRALRPTNK
jgi:hypothetical protein